MMPILSGVLILGLLVLLHELGHFWAARWAGVKVQTFSVGFGRKLVGRQIGETEYRLSLFPLGGYVEMLQTPAESPALRGRSFQEQPGWKRAVIIVAGPAINLLLPFLLLPLAFWSGIQVPAYQDSVARIGYVSPGGLADQAGLVVGDVILGIEDVPVHTWAEAVTVAAQAVTHPYRDMTVLRQTGLVEKLTLPVENTLEGWGLWPEADPVVGSLTPDMPGAAAGLLPGDRVVAIEGQSIASWHALVGSLQQAQGAPLRLTVQEADQTPRDVVLEAKRVGDRFLAGIVQHQTLVTSAYEFPTALRLGLERVMAMFGSTLEFLRNLVAGGVSAESVGGPIAIVQFAGQATLGGWAAVLTVVAFLSLQLGILNLFPIPVFDGGQLLLLAYESVMGTPLSQRAQAGFQGVGLAMVAALMVFAFYNDLARLL